MLNLLGLRVILVSQKPVNNFSEHGHAVAPLLPRRANQRGIPVSGVSDQLPQEVRFAIELDSVSSLELGPFFRVVFKPFAMSGARREVSQPPIEFGIRFSHTSRPESINEDSITVVGLCSLVNPFDFDHNPTGILPHFPCPRARSALEVTRVLLK